MDNTPSTCHLLIFLIQKVVPGLLHFEDFQQTYLLRLESLQNSTDRRPPDGILKTFTFLVCYGRIFSTGLLSGDMQKIPSTGVLLIKEFSKNFYEQKTCHRSFTDRGIPSKRLMLIKDIRQFFLGRESSKRLLYIEDFPQVFYG